MRIVLIIVLLFPTASLAKPSELCLFGWNLESGDSRLSTINRLFQPLADCDVFALTEVADIQTLQTLTKTANAVTGKAIYTWLIGNTNRVGHDGIADYVGLIFNAEKLALQRTQELFHINPSLTKGRAPLVAHFAYRKDTGKRFAVVAVHLARGSKKFRNHQATLLNQWVRSHRYPVFAVGDFNFDYVIATGRHDPAYAAMTKGNHWHWLRPQQLHATTCTGGRYPPSVLDFIFANKAAKQWQVLESSILLPDLCGATGKDNSKRPDHKPTVVRLTPPR